MCAQTNESTATKPSSGLGNYLTIKVSCQQMRKLFAFKI